MNKYIDAEKLLAEIERRRLSNRYIDTEGYENELLEIITSLQQEQPEVDLEKEIKNYLATKCAGDDEPSVSEIARHFFELGFSAGMEKSNGVDGVVHHALKSHWIVTDKNKLAAILKAFPEGAEVELFICAKK